MKKYFLNKFTLAFTQPLNELYCNVIAAPHKKDEDTNPVARMNKIMYKKKKRAKGSKEDTDKKSSSREESDKGKNYFFCGSSDDVII